jgi:tetratricopeptide (TPR) repeat protein
MATVVDLVTQLVEKSMVLMDSRPDMARYRFLEPIPQFALEQLESSGELATWRARHADGLLALAVVGEAHLAGPEEIASLDRLELEHDNIRLALRWYVGHADGESALRLSTAMWRFWERRGHHLEGCSWLDRALASADTVPTAARGNALNALAMLHWATGRAEVARPFAEQALGVCRAAGDTRGVAWALISLGMIAYYQTNARLALALLEEGVANAREAADLPLSSLALSCLGRVLLWADGPDEPRVAASMESSLDLATTAQSRHAIGQALSALGELAWRQGDAPGATQRWQQALELRRQLRDHRGIATSLECLALSAAACGQLQRAAWLWGAADTQRAAIGMQLRHDEQAEHAQLIAATRESMGEPSFGAAWTDGQGASVDDAVTRALVADGLVAPATLAASTR